MGQVNKKAIPNVESGLASTLSILDQKLGTIGLPSISLAAFTNRNIASVIIATLDIIKTKPVAYQILSTD